ncbi:response regulator [Sphingomonas sp. LY160]|uniref:response regulator n=1 Tax=Sphingomonas sp. LY160 TaxID=3095342 RepID=UPI002ADEA6CF|nr:response regulator [Sphingomonas sp. LY160]MEA1072060.1 response regulator [Sphingomonas sp. LY160]
MLASPLLLLVEDEPLIRVSVADALTDGGYDVREAETADEALALLDSDLNFLGLITDVRLRAESGWDLARHARQLSPSMAVIYMTGDSAADWAAEGVPNSMLLQKPFATAQMTTAISTLLNASEAAPAASATG